MELLSGSVLKYAVAGFVAALVFAFVLPLENSLPVINGFLAHIVNLVVGFALLNVDGAPAKLIGGGFFIAGIIGLTDSVLPMFNIQTAGQPAGK